MLEFIFAPEVAKKWGISERRIQKLCEESRIPGEAKFGWYRYDTRFAIPVYDDAGELVRYNVFKARILVRHAKDGKLYLYDILRTKKETSKPLEQ